ncbi:MAG: hypothetical protein LKJ74_05245 [Clostridiales bacterium]|jgi:hypothetical protein|nr:hypothetical protein [Clostridiales bacterium]MCI2161734.1 hypothetical protein [Oscillospiraceae bacterium]MCI2191700.1 hypothetical protein [Oscillospiraceae bacterium]MCI2205667.1 hypothetical protein [Oscillospiraceae bacterium]
MSEHKNTAPAVGAAQGGKRMDDTVKVQHNPENVKLSPEAESKLNDLAAADPVGTMLDLFNAMRPHDLRSGTKIKLSCHGYTVSVKREDTK